MPEGLTLRAVPSQHPATILDTRAAVEVDTTIYSLVAILRAAYKLTNRCYVFVAKLEGSSDRVIVTLTPKIEATPLPAMVGDFCNELLDQQVRESLADEFGDIRTLIVAQAFSEGNLLDTKRDDGDYEADSRETLHRR